VRLARESGKLHSAARRSDASPINWAILTSRRRETGSPPAFPGVPGASIDASTVRCPLPPYLPRLLYRSRDEHQRHRRNVGTNCCAPNRPMRHGTITPTRLSSAMRLARTRSRRRERARTDHLPPPPVSGCLVPPPSAASASHRLGGLSRPVLFVPTTRRYNDRSMLNTQEGKRRSNMAAPVTAPRSPSSEDSNPSCLSARRLAGIEIRV